jgi:HSP20 family protein
LEDGIMNGSPMSKRWDPLRDFQREVGRLFETLEPLPHWRFQRPYPAVNLYDAGEHYIVAAELPGMSPEEIDLAITGETLTLRGERKRPEGAMEESYRRQERLFGRWSRAVTLPDRVDSSRASAQFSNGILVVTLPKSEDARPKHIVVTASP